MHPSDVDAESTVVHLRRRSLVSHVMVVVVMSGVKRVQRTASSKAKAS